MAKPTTISISMPASMAEFVKRRMAEKGYGNTSEYFRQLVREDRKLAEQDALEAMLLEGFKGKPIEVNEEYWRRAKERLAARVKKRKTA
jgi:antitoxin ParD1/3/4